MVKHDSSFLVKMVIIMVDALIAVISSVVGSVGINSHGWPVIKMWYAGRYSYHKKFSHHLGSL